MNVANSIVNHPQLGFICWYTSFLNLDAPNGWSMEWSVKNVFTTWPEKTVGSDCLSVLIGRFQSDKKELKQQRATSSDSEFGKLDPARPTRGYPLVI